MGAATTPTAFGRWLRSELDGRNIGVRTLARTIDRSQTELVRRNLNRYLYDGVRPSPMMRARIADALGVKPSEIPTDDDDEEEDSVKEFLDALRPLARLLARQQEALETA